jgi:hypothetical protein
VHRSTNNAAHMVARMAVSELIERTWRVEYPNCIHELFCGRHPTLFLIK